MTRSNLVMRSIEEYKQHSRVRKNNSLEDMTGWFKQTSSSKPHSKHNREHRGEREYAKGYWR